MAISGRLRKLRIDKGLTQTDLAIVFNIGQSTLAAYELGKRQLPLDLLVKFARYYDVSTDYLLDMDVDTK